jgi:hypothetical protein
MQLLESFARITGAGNQIIYSTHSHYMINPDWLDQAFIVSNAAIDYDKAYQNDNVEAKTDISATRYRGFVGEHPDKVTYFQPVLDKLDVAPSRLDLVKKSVLVEGKGDYRLLEYISRFGVGKERDFSIVPTRGASGMDELLGLFLGWSVPFVVCLDDDKEGKIAQKRYIEEWGLPNAVVLTLADVHADLKGKRVEDILDDADRETVCKHFDVSKISKNQIGLFFSEMLAREEKIEISNKAIERVAAFQTAVENAFDA